jgi:hypothetical protein
LKSPPCIMIKSLICCGNNRFTSFSCI